MERRTQLSFLDFHFADGKPVILGFNNKTKYKPYVCPEINHTHIETNYSKLYYITFNHPLQYYQSYN